MLRTVSVVMLLVLAGCASRIPEGPLPNDPYYAPVTADIPQQKLARDGSIFHPQVAKELYSDAVARNVGDILTVVLSERTSASKSANTSTAKETDVAVNPILGLGGNAVNIGDQSIQLSAGASNDFSGDAEAKQSNNLAGNITVTVVQVMPNRNLVVRGEKWLTLNSGDEYIRLTGIVRPADIGPANEVQSTRIANARIQYSGTGSFASAQQPGWLSRFFSSSYWPF